MDFQLGGERANNNCDHCCKKKIHFINFSCLLCDNVTRYCDECCEKRNLVVMCRCGKSSKMVHISKFYEEYKDVMFEFVNGEIIFRDNCCETCEYCNEEDCTEMVKYKCECGDVEKSYCKNCCLNNDILVFVCEKCIEEGYKFLISEYHKKHLNRYLVK